MIGTLRRALQRGTRSTAMYECRHCGTGVDPGIGACPACGSDEIASYSF